MSSGRGGEEDGDDEISKLISRRSQIKRRKREDDNIKSAESLTTTASGESIVDINLDALPEFKTERPVRSRRADNEDESSSSSDEGEDDDGSSATGRSKSASSSSSLPIVDFRADYDDENDLHVPNRMGVSTRAWGDPRLNFSAAVSGGGSTNKLTKRDIKMGKFVAGDVQLAHAKLLEGGITLFETSPAYGAASRPSQLSSEDILKRCLEEAGEGSLPETILIENLSVTSLFSALVKPSTYLPNQLEESLNRLGGLATIELFQAPSKATLFSSRLLAAGLAAALESGQCNHVGVTGVTSARKLRRIQRKLEARDAALTSNMFEFSLTNRKHERMIDACKSLGVIPLVCNPLDDGLASGVFTATNPSGGQVNPSRKFSFQQLEKLQPLHSVLETVSDRVKTRVIREMRDTQERYKPRYGPPPKINTDITTTQVALNYVISKGGVPLPEVNTPRQAQEVLGCLGWDLANDEVAMLDAAADLCSN
jgi:aryl-alcohol dehydrogenase-like predicted oxidoreductase